MLKCPVPSSYRVSRKHLCYEFLHEEVTDPRETFQRKENMKVSQEWSCVYAVTKYRSPQGARLAHARRPWPKNEQPGIVGHLRKGSNMENRCKKKNSNSMGVTKTRGNNRRIFR